MADGVTDGGINAASLIAKAAAIAVAIIQTEAAIEAATREWELAKKWYDISEQQIDYYYAIYAPCEAKEILEACSAEDYVMHKEVSRGRMQSYVQQQFSRRPYEDIKCLSRYCSGAKKQVIKNVERAKLAALTTAANLANRYEEATWDAMDDRRWARRTQALNRGRDMMSDAVSFSSFANGLYGDLGAQATMAVNSSLESLGFAFNRNPTQYPSLNPVNRPYTPATAYAAPPDPPIMGTSHTPAPRQFIKD